MFTARYKSRIQIHFLLSLFYKWLNTSSIKATQTQRHGAEHEALSEGFCYNDRYSEPNTFEHIILFTRCSLGLTTCFGLIFWAIISSYLLFKETIKYVILTFKAYCLRDAPTSLTFNNCTLCPRCIYVFCIYLRTISLCCKWHKSLFVLR